ncbi:MATA-HMG [Gigaspora margarita]|uniref:MATA-HMG n=1 Tax=Gigaspora margarita TaxID=4874 RepID=A0A8H3X9R2_GIGMA|nr:MATA-HMG [Gigaspora margarita]
MKERASKTAKSRGIRFASIITSNVTRVGSSCANGYSFQNEYVINDEQKHTVPYKLSLNIDDLINPSKTSRRSKKTNDPPRPQNCFVLFRRDFEVKYRLLHKDENIFSKKISSLAAESWNVQPPSVRFFFKQLEVKALNKHQEMFPNYRYQPNKKKQNPNNVLGESCLNFVTSQSQVIESPTQTSPILNVPTTKVSNNDTNVVVDYSNTFIQEDDSSYSFNYTFIQEDDFRYNFNNTFIQEVDFNYYFNNNTFLSCNNDFFDPASYNTVLFETDDINYYVSEFNSRNFIF